MKHVIFKSTLMILVSGLFLVSCVDKDNEKPEPDYSTNSDNANSQSGFDDLAKVTEDALSTNGDARLSAPGTPISCATVDIVVLATDSIKYTINFPGGSCNDGKIRSGTIVAVLDGATYNTPGATLTIATTDYMVNGIKLEGKKVITCVSSTVHNISVSDVIGTGMAKITYLDGKTATWKSKRTRTLVSGAGTGTILDNVYDISTTTGIGNPIATGVNRNGTSYSVDVTTPIRVDFSCFANNTARYPTQGVLSVTPNSKEAMSVNYGDGTCDNKVQVTYYGKTYDISLSY